VILLELLLFSSLAAPSTDWQMAELEAMGRVNYARQHGFNCATKGYGGAPMPALIPHLKLRAAAREHAADMQSRGYFAHDTPDGLTVKDRVTAAGYTWSRASENILGGQRLGSSARNAVKWWLMSPVHCQNIMNPGFKHFAAGHVFVGSDPAGIKHYWVLVFAAPATKK
jgi:uncharacterized protein YkwD